MTWNHARVILAAALMGGGLCVADSAAAQATRTWVSGVGDDANPCSRTAPCKTFAGAISKTAAGGEINCLDPGGFGGVTITKSMSILCQFTEAGVLVSGTNGIIINAGVSDVVVLRGLDIEGAGTGLSGIRILQVGAVEVHDTTISDFRGASGTGITFAPPNAGARLIVRNSIISNNVGAGIFVQPTGTGTADVIVDGSQVALNAGIGITVNTAGNTGTGNRLEIRNSQISANAIGGIAANAQTGNAKATVSIIGSTLAFNANFGIQVNGALAAAFLTGNQVQGSTTGVNIANGAVVTSFTDNALFNNTANVTAGQSLTPASKQ